MTSSVKRPSSFRIVDILGEQKSKEVEKQAWDIENSIRKFKPQDHYTDSKRRIEDVDRAESAISRYFEHPPVLSLRDRRNKLVDNLHLDIDVDTQNQAQLVSSSGYRNSQQNTNLSLPHPPSLISDGLLHRRINMCTKDGAHYNPFSPLSPKHFNKLDYFQFERNKSPSSLYSLQKCHQCRLSNENHGYKSQHCCHNNRHPKHRRYTTSPNYTVERCSTMCSLSRPSSICTSQSTVLSSPPLYRHLPCTISSPNSSTQCSPIRNDTGLCIKFREYMRKIYKRQQKYICFR